MSSRKFLTPLRIEPKPSRYYYALMLALYCLTVLSLFLSSIAWYWKLSVLLFLLFYFINQTQPHVQLRCRRCVRFALWSADGHWQIQTNSGDLHAAELLADSLNHPWLVILRFKTRTGKRFNLPLFRDSLPDEMHRQLRARLTVSHSVSTESG